MSITVSLETAKKLKEKGREKETVFRHKYVNKEWVTVYTNTWRPTAQEIINELPAVHDVWYLYWNVDYMLTMTKKSALYLDPFAETLKDWTYISFDWDNLVEALAQIWIYFKENDFLPQFREENL